ncbi:MAG: glycoside hydrolase TIM-barrel-like domain-containing protein [Rhodobacteraceae bacterium]|nr:glycoside hydrolase TIM-barrel-like domain-containing protein [Paracoccaceae bacterium]
MATILLSAVGGAIGTSIGGSVLGLGAAVIGRAIGGTIGNIIDNGLLGGSEAVEHGRVDTLRIQGSGEGKPIAQVYGQMRVAGHVIWSSKFKENVSGGGKGFGGPNVREYSYSISLGIALCEGEVTRIGRVWVDGKRLDMTGINWRLHVGSEIQMPDPAIDAIEEDAPAYRGTAYIVFEDLDLTQFGNRIPQFNFEVVRSAQGGLDQPADLINGVALIPGTGEYSLATEPVYYKEGRGDNRSANTNNMSGLVDVLQSLEQLSGDLPNCESVSLVVSWFGNDLRCDTCSIYPAVEQNTVDGTPMAWRVSGVGRGAAPLIGRDDEDRPIYGGTPCDESVLQSIAELKSSGKDIMFYPFVLMDIAEGNGLTDPYGGAEQAKFPWRGRITGAIAPGQAGTSDKTAAMFAEVSAFFGTATVGDFSPTANGVNYSGPAEWSYRRFILHYAHLCALAGGVEAFCIGSELRGLTTLRDGVDSFPAVDALIALAADVRSILPATKISYAADWSEYFGYQPTDGSGDVLFHLDPFWADDNVDFIGIDNYMPLSDWRDSEGHLDAEFGSIYNLDYLKSNIAGGEKYDWYYATDEARKLQVRSPITDGAYGEDWIFRPKDLLSWWTRGHSNRINGVRVAGYTDWVPKSKPFWFTEIGCPAVDKGTNQPNVFVDPKSSESALPYFSNGARDDFMQMRYLQALYGYWNDPLNNPISLEYGGPMVEMSRAHVWAWDARPWPDFPTRLSVWSDGDNFARGHWISGRSGSVSLASVVREVCARSNLAHVNVSELYGAVQGFVLNQNETARQALQPLMLAFGFECFERGGEMVFCNRDGVSDAKITVDWLAIDGHDAVVSLTRNPESETAATVRIGFVDGNNDYQSGAAEASFPDDNEPRVTASALPISLSSGTAQGIASRWLAEARIARDTLEFSLPPSQMNLGAGDVVALDTQGVEARYRIDRVEEMGVRKVSATRVEPGVYRPVANDDRSIDPGGLVSSGPVFAQFMDLPLLTGSEIAHAPYFAVTATPWPGAMAVYAASTDAGYALVGGVDRNAVMGKTLNVLPEADPARWSGGSFSVRLDSGALQSRSMLDVLNGANVAAIRTTGDWEVFQFQNADLIAPGEYRLSGLLRGQAGTDGIMPDIWPIGADFVLLDGAPTQMDLPVNQRDLDRHYRVGPANAAYDSDRYMHLVEVFAGVGQRPYPVAHLRCDGGADLGVSWVRRTRVDGDSWAGLDVPLGEETETYAVKVIKAGATLFETSVSTPSWTYLAAQQVSDGAVAPFEIHVAQTSTSFGNGPYQRIDINV